MRPLFLLFFPALVAGQVSYSAPCCSGTSSASTVITGDDQSQFGVSAARSIVIGDVYGDGQAVFRGEQTDEITQSLALSAATLLSDRWQLGGQIAVIAKSIQSGGVTESATALGDPAFTLAYEWLPDWSYSTWRPKGYLFATVKAPVGRSIHEVGAETARATSTGAWHTVFGLQLLKNWENWDGSMVGQVGCLWGRRLLSPTGREIETSSAVTASLSGAMGWSPGGGIFRLGVRVEPQWQSGRDGTPYRLVWNSAFDFGVLASEGASVVATYLDQTLLGPAQNTVLERSLSLALVYRFPR